MSSNMRKVKVMKPVRKVEDGKSMLHEEFDYFAKFHHWGVDFEEFEGGPGNYTVAIVEKKDGVVKSIPAELIQFVADS